MQSICTILKCTVLVATFISFIHFILSDTYSLTSFRIVQIKFGCAVLCNIVQCHRLSIYCCCVSCTVTANQIPPGWKVKFWTELKWTEHLWLTYVICIFTYITNEKLWKKWVWCCVMMSSISNKILCHHWGAEKESGATRGNVGGLMCGPPKIWQKEEKRDSKRARECWSEVKAVTTLT